MEGEILNHYYIFPLSSLVELSIINSDLKKSGIDGDGFHLSSLKMVLVGNSIQ